MAITTVDLVVHNSDAGSMDHDSSSQLTERFGTNLLRNGGSGDPFGLDLSAIQKGSNVLLWVHFTVISDHLRYKSANPSALHWIGSPTLTLYNIHRSSYCTRSNWPAVPLFRTIPYLRSDRTRQFFSAAAISLA